MALQRLALEFLLIDGGSAVAKRLGQGLRQLGADGERAADGVDRMVDRLNSGLKLLGTARTLKESLLDPGLQAASSLQAALNRLEVNLDGGSVDDTRKQLQALAKDAARVAGPTKFSQEEILGVQTELIKAGLSQKDVLGRGGAAEAAAQLATAEGTDARAATDAILTLAGTFRLTGDQFAHSADLLVRAGGASTVGPDDIREALKMVTGAGDLDQREVLAALGAVGTTLKGSMAGTSMDAFLLQAAKNDKKYQLGLYDNGALKSLPDVAEALRARFGGMTEQGRIVALNKAFGDQGARFAQALMKSGSGSIEDVLAKMDASRSLQERTDVMSKGLTAQRDALAGTISTTMATLFSPALDPLAMAAAKLNDATGALNSAAEENAGISKAVSYGALGAVGLTGALGLARVAQGGLGGLATLGSISRLGGFSKLLLGSAGGVAAGKAAEAAAGVTPVFVTNWPGGFVPPVVGAGASAAAAGGLGTRLAAGGAALGGGYAVGTAINEGLIQGTEVERLIQAGFATTMLSWGRMFQSEEDLAGYRKVQDRSDVFRSLKEALGLTVSVQVQSDGTANVDARFDDGSGVAAAGRMGAL